jgi:polyisoprenoid-binding protein YceI
MEPAGAPGSYKVSGEITLKGVTRPHEDLMEIRAVDDSTISLSGKSRFDIREFGMEPPRVLILKVEPEVDVRVEIIAEKVS